MDNIPVRSPIAMIYRRLLASLERWMVLPNIRPSFYDVAGILLSLSLFVITSPWLKILILAMVLLTDWLDGATARQYCQLKKEGYMMDVMIDRASEGLIFASGIGTVLGKVFFLLWMLNLVLCFYSVFSKKHTSLPLRFVYMVALIVQVLLG